MFWHVPFDMVGPVDSVFVNGLRTKFYRNPRPVLNQYSQELEDRVACNGKLTYAHAVDMCPVLAWVAWAVMNGMFGFAPLLLLNGVVYLNTRNSFFSSAADVDAVVDSIWAVKPDCVPREMQDVPVFSGQLIGGSQQVVTSTVSNVALQVGMRLGVDPSKCSAVSGRKTLATATVVHSETNDLDCTRTFGHVNPWLTTQAVYTDAPARTADSRAILIGSTMRDLPGSVQLAHRRNPDAFLAHQRATTAAAAVGPGADLPTLACEEQQRHRAQVRLSEYRSEMQRQYNEQCRLPRAGETAVQLAACPFNFRSYDGMSPKEFVAHTVKVALGFN